MIYFIIAFLILICVCIYDLGNYKRFKHLTFIFFYCVLTIFAAIRYRVGGDTSNYMHMHQFFPNLMELIDSTERENIFKYEIGWVLFSSLAKVFTDNFILVQIIHALFINLAIFKFIKSNTTFIFTATLFYFICLYPYLNFEILRQAISIAVFITFGLPYLTNGKISKYIITVVLCTCFHYSSIVLLLLLVFFKFKHTLSKNLFLGSLFLFLMSMAFNRFFSLENLLFVDQLLGTNKMFIYSDYQLTTIGYLSLYLLNILVPLCIYKAISFTRFERSNYKFIIIVFIYLSAVSAVFPILSRTLYFLYPVFLIAIAEVIFSPLLMKRLTLVLRLILFVGFFCSLVAINLFKYFAVVDKERNIKWYVRWHPYYTIFSKQEDQVRESLLVH